MRVRLARLRHRVPKHTNALAELHGLPVKCQHDKMGEMPSLIRCFYPVFNLYKEPSFTHVYIVLYSATMLMIGHSTFREEEEEEDDSRIRRRLELKFYFCAFSSLITIVLL